VFLFAGLILDVTGNYMGSFLIGGISLILSSLFMIFPMRYKDVASNSGVAIRVKCNQSYIDSHLTKPLNTDEETDNNGVKQELLNDDDAKQELLNDDDAKHALPNEDDVNHDLRNGDDVNHDLRNNDVKDDLRNTYVKHSLPNDKFAILNADVKYDLPNNDVKHNLRNNYVNHALPNDDHVTLV